MNCLICGTEVRGSGWMCEEHKTSYSGPSYNELREMGLLERGKKTAEQQEKLRRWYMRHNINVFPTA